MSAWIKMINDSEANNELNEVLKLARTPHGTVDNVMRVHSLRPSTMRGHIFLYRSVLHDETNTIPTWFQETISSYVSIINNCKYSLSNHWANACHLINDIKKSEKIKLALDKRSPGDVFEGKELAFLQYAEKLTLSPSEMNENDVINLRRYGASDGEILEANQIICYFNYVNRSINGLGVTTKGDTVGYYKN
tara:strand:+ start:3308 stop:3883 length:576 start_codon:yes stop_codon:yes gene_type:complete